MCDHISDDPKSHAHKVIVIDSEQSFQHIEIMGLEVVGDDSEIVEL